MEIHMAKVTIQDLMEAGCHFGHQTKRWNPKMKEFVYGSQNGISIIDLTKTIRQIADACNFLQRIVADGGNILFVGTKRQAQQVVKEASEKTDMFYVAERWMGGILTNNVTIRKSINRMKDIDKTIESEKDTPTIKKKEIVKLAKLSEKLHLDLDGISEMRRLPQALVVVDVCHDHIAIAEARKLKIPIVAIVDTNGDPEKVDYPIAANDDAVRSIQIIVDLFIESIAVANEIYKKKASEAQQAKAEAAKAAGDEDKGGDRRSAAPRRDAQGGDKKRTLRRKKTEGGAEDAEAARRKAAPKKKEAGE